MSNKPSGGLNAFVIKCLAMLAMTLDHVAWAFFDVNSHLSEWLHFIGRMVAPIMVYLLVVGIITRMMSWLMLGGYWSLR